MQISYHSVLTKIQKLQNLKKKKKKLFSVPVSIAQNWLVRLVQGQYGQYFFRYEIGGRVYRIADRYGTESITLFWGYSVELGC